MPSPEVLDLQAVFAPIPGENPAGEDVRYSGPYDAIQEARRSDDDLPQGEWQRETKSADWPAVIRISSEVLAAKSKDLQVGVWLVEALVKSYGFSGLRDGLRLLKELQENFWESLYPVIEDGDLEFRAGPLQWLNEKLSPCVREVALTHGENRYTWHHWEESRIVDNLGRQSQEAVAAAVAEGKITGEQFDKAVAATPRAYFETILEDLNQGHEECGQLIEVVDEKFGRQGPSLLEIRKALEDCRALVEDIVKEKRRLDPNYKHEEPVARTDRARVEAPMGAAAASGLSREPTSREDAFQRLAVIADYLKRIEPQNPVSYLVERAVRWSKMPLEDWLGEVVQNEDVLNRLRETLGIKDQQSS